VLVEEDDDLLAVVGVEVGGEVEEGPLVEGLLGRAVEDLLEAPRVHRVEPATIEQMAVLLEQVDDLLTDLAPAVLERVPLRPLEGQVDDRVALEVGTVRVARLPDGEVLEEGGEVLGALLEEAPQHREVQGLAEAAGARQEDDLHARGVEQLADQVRLVDVGE